MVSELIKNEGIRTDAILNMHRFYADSLKSAVVAADIHLFVADGADVRTDLDNTHNLYPGSGYHKFDVHSSHMILCFGSVRMTFPSY